MTSSDGRSAVTPPTGSSSRPSASSAPPAPGRSAAATAGYLAIALGVGVLLPAQARITGALGVRLDDGMLAAWLTSFVGLVFAGLLAVLLPSARRAFASIPQAVRSRAFPWWAMLAGLFAAYLVVTQGVVAGVTGVALFTIAFVAGQTLGGIGVDVWGIGPAGRKRITRERLAGAVTILAAVVLAVTPSITAGSDGTALLLLLPFTAGLVNGLQTVMNGMQTAHYRNFVPATFINFAVGLIGLGLILLVQGIIAGGWATPPLEAWLYLGGPLGVLIVGGAASLAKHLGVLLTSLGMIAGQLAGALLLDLAWPTEEAAGFPWLELAGTALALAGVIIASLPRGPVAVTAGPASAPSPPAQETR